MSSQHVTVSLATINIEVRVVDHGRVRLQVRTIEPSVQFLSIVNSVLGKQEADSSTRQEGPVAEGEASSSGRLYLREVMDEALIGHDGDASLVALHSTAEEDGCGVEHDSSYYPVEAEGVLVLTFHLTHILPRNAFGISSVFTEPIRKPRVTSEVISEEVHVRVFLFLVRFTSRSNFKNLVCFSLFLVASLLSRRVVLRLRKNVVVGAVKMARHV